MQKGVQPLIILQVYSVVHVARPMCVQLSRKNVDESIARHIYTFSMNEFCDAGGWMSDVSA